MFKKQIKKPVSVKSDLDKKIADHTHEVRKKLGGIDFHLDQIKAAMAKNECVDEAMAGKPLHTAIVQRDDGHYNVMQGDKVLGHVEKHKYKWDAFIDGKQISGKHPSSAHAALSIDRHHMKNEEVESITEVKIGSTVKYGTSTADGLKTRTSRVVKVADNKIHLSSGAVLDKYDRVAKGQIKMHRDFHPVDEAVEPIDEIKQSILRAYVRKAGKDATTKAATSGQIDFHRKNGDRYPELKQKAADQLSKKVQNRMVGIRRASARIREGLDEAMDMSGFIEVGLFNGEQDKVRLVRHPSHFDEHYVLDSKGNMHAAYTGPTGHVIDQMSRDGYSPDQDSNDVVERRDERTFNYPNKIKQIIPQGKGHVVVRLHNGDKYHVHASETQGKMPRPGERLDTSKHQVCEGTEMDIDEGKTFKDTRDEYRAERSRNFDRALKKGSRFRKLARTATRRVDDSVKEELVDEISKGLAGRYIKAAAHNIDDKAFDHGGTFYRQELPVSQSDKAANSAAQKKLRNRKTGVSRAVDKILGTDGRKVNATEDVEQVEERDMGKKGKNFAKIAAKSGGGEKGARIAGAILAKLRAKHPRAYAEETEMDEAVDGPRSVYRSEIRSPESRKLMNVKGGNRYRITAKQHAALNRDPVLRQVGRDYIVKKNSFTKESEELDELSVATLKNYRRKANAQIAKSVNTGIDTRATINRRTPGTYNASAKIIGSAKVRATEETEIDEGSAAGFAAYRSKKASTGDLVKSYLDKGGKVTRGETQPMHSGLKYRANYARGINSANSEVAKDPNNPAVITPEKKRKARIAAIMKSRGHTTEETVDEGKTFRVDIDGSSGRTVIKAKSFKNALKRASAQRRHDSLSKRASTVNNID